jgi:hypothetical protein
MRWNETYDPAVGLWAFTLALGLFVEKRASSPAPHRGGRRGVACPFARSRKGGGWVVYDCAALGREAGGGGAGEDCCEGFILHRKCGRQPAAENDEQTLPAVLLSMFARRSLSSLSARFASARLIGYRSTDL